MIVTRENLKTIKPGKYIITKLAENDNSRLANDLPFLWTVFHLAEESHIKEEGYMTFYMDNNNNAILKWGFTIHDYSDNTKSEQSDNIPHSGKHDYKLPVRETEEQQRVSQYEYPHLVPGKQA